MFPTEDEKVFETRAERQARRARSGMDRHGLKQVVLAFIFTFLGMTALVAADTARVERRLTDATVVGLADLRHSHECVTQLATGYGYARLYTHNFCRYASWHVGDTAEVVARRLRFTRTIVLSTRGTIFEGAHSILPEW